MRAGFPRSSGPLHRAHQVPGTPLSRRAQHLLSLAPPLCTTLFLFLARGPDLCRKCFVSLLDSKHQHARNIKHIAQEDLYQTPSSCSTSVLVRAARKVRPSLLVRAPPSAAVSAPAGLTASRLVKRPSRGPEGRPGLAGDSAAGLWPQAPGGDAMPTTFLPKTQFSEAPGPNHGALNEEAFCWQAGLAGVGGGEITGLK